MEVLTVKEAAAFLKISPDKVYELVKTAGFPSFPLGRSIRIEKEALSHWIAAQMGRSANE